jgi:hypothetical protein
MRNTLPPPLKEQRAVDGPPFMEATSETWDGFIRLAIFKDDASHLGDILKAGTVQ